MAINGVLRPGFVQVRVLDLDAAIVHYRDRVGLDLVSRDGDRAYLRATDEFDRHSLVLREAQEPGLDVIGFKVRRPDDLDRLKANLLAMSVPVEEIAPYEQPGLGRRIRFTTPTGHSFDLYAEFELSCACPMTNNPDLWQVEPRGMRVLRFDHCLVTGTDIAGSARIFREALGFELAEELVDEVSGQPLALFLTCSNKAHDIAFVGSPQDGRLHHVSFLLESWHDVGHAADVMARYDISVDIGPTRHGITRGQTIYFFDPSGNRNEVFCGGYQFYPDHPVRRWNAENAGKAIFYYEKQIHDTFLNVTT